MSTVQQSEDIDVAQKESQEKQESQEKLLKEAAQHAQKLYPLADPLDYPDNPNVNRLNRSCQGAFMAGFHYASQKLEEYLGQPRF